MNLMMIAKLTLMNLTIVVNPTREWAPEDYDNGLLNGSEEMVTLFARKMATRNFTVDVYCSLKGGACLDVMFDDSELVSYYDLSQLPNRTQGGILVAFKNRKALSLTGFKQKYLWTADPEVLSGYERKECEAMFGLGPFHERELKSLNIGYLPISYIAPGVDKEECNIKRVPKQCLYASSPDRGLDYLRQIWPQINEAHPDATLMTTYSASTRFTNEEMVELYCQSDILAYPCSGAERYCITAIKAQMYGAIPCVIPNMALQDTVQFGEKCLQRDYLKTIIDLLGDKERRLSIRQKMIKDVKYNTWDEVADSWEKIIGVRSGHSSS